MTIKTGEQQYLELAQRIVDEGVDIKNERTGKVCRTVINADFTYDCRNGELPLITTRKSFWKAAIAEIVGYMLGCDNAAQFKHLGTPTWFANANENEAWLNNKHRKGKDDMGRVYGVQGRDWINQEGQHFDQLADIIKNLKEGNDTRGLIWNFYNPGEIHMGCLRPCMYSHHFSVLDGTLYLNSTQRSIDVPLGLNFNMVQVVALLMIMAKITGLKTGIAYHKLVNCHIYDDQLDLMKNIQLKRTPFNPPTLHISDEITSLQDLEKWLDDKNFDIANYFKVEGYEHHEGIKYPFAV